MLTENEYTIVKTLVEEEMGYLVTARSEDAGVMSKYLSTLSNIVDKLKNYAEDNSFSQNISVR